MKQMMILSISFLVTVTSHALTTPSGEPPLNAHELLLPIGSSGKWISMMELATISVKEFEVLNEKKLSFFQKIGFRLSQRKLRNKINDDGTFTGKALQKVANNIVEGDSGFHAGGFFMGLLLNIYAIPIVYLMKDANRKQRIKWMWIGLGVVTTLLALLLLAMAGGRFR